MLQNMRLSAVGLACLILFILTIPAGNWFVTNVGLVCEPDGPCLIPVWPGIMSPSAVLLAGFASYCGMPCKRCLAIDGRS